MSLAVHQPAGSSQDLYFPEIPTPPLLIAFPISLSLKALLLISYSVCLPISYPTCFLKQGFFSSTLSMCGSLLGCWVLQPESSVCHGRTEKSMWSIEAHLRLGTFCISPLPLAGAHAYKCTHSLYLSLLLSKLRTPSVLGVEYLCFSSRWVSWPLFFFWLTFSFLYLNYFLTFLLLILLGMIMQWWKK